MKTYQMPIYSLINYYKQFYYIYKSYIYKQLYINKKCCRQF